MVGHVAASVVLRLNGDDLASEVRGWFAPDESFRKFFWKYAVLRRNAFPEISRENRGCLVLHSGKLAS